MSLNTKMCELLNIKYPIILAGMAGGPTTVDLIVSVSEAGGLGTLGAAYMKPEDIRSTIKEIRLRTDKPFGVNLFCTNMNDNLKGLQRVQEVLNKMRFKLEIDQEVLEVKTPQLFNEQIQVLIEEKVPIISTAFGLMPLKWMQLAKNNGSKIITMVTTVDEAIKAEKYGVDAIVAQGSEAGGHRGTFDVEKFPNGANIGTFTLIPQVVNHVNIPVIAAGGVMDGRGLAAALILGAQGVQMGTAFLVTKESGAHPIYKKVISNSTEDSTVITKSFSGRPARGIYNEFIREFENEKIAPLAFPSQNTITSDIRKQATKQNNHEYMSLWAGQGTRLLREDVTAKDVVNQVVEEANSLFKQYQI
ncbi:MULTISPECIES: nitronate monooxygenase family protein [unclassified Bacillus cereus group]|uniref:NAD(P)H-dependent flavin oxidoreductase n=1 Tax=unclassified Bacillus cereus group TaxID=2750818 RepID=UPI001F58CAB5|nr:MULTISPECIES: nitronate monooxygenase family protein [unclassified Bacillus cereus group]